MPNFDILKGADGKFDLGRATGLLLIVVASVWVANKIPGLKKVV